MATIQGPADTSHLLANLASGALEGWLAGRKMGQENRAEARGVEVQQAELKSQQLDDQLKQAQLDEFNAMQELRRAKMQAEVIALRAKDPVEMKRLSVEKARWDAKAAEARARREQLELEKEQQIREFTDFLNKLRTGVSGGGEPTSMGEAEDTGMDTADIPASEYAPGITPEETDTTGTMFPPPGVQSTVPGGRQVMQGPMLPGDVKGQEATSPFTYPGDIARSILPPGIVSKPKSRVLPISVQETEAALKSKDMNDAIRKLLTTEGPAFGSELIKLKQENPAKYLEQVSKLVDEHAKGHPDVYSAFKVKGTQGSKLRDEVMRILTDPEERAIQNPMKDIDAAVSESVADLSVEALLSTNSRSRIRSYLTIDAANDGNIARYHGRQLNQALDDTFGGAGRAIRFSEDLDYTLRQVVQALYTDEMSVTGNALLGYTEPVKESYQRPAEHKILAFLNSYWQPMRDLESQDRRKIYEQSILPQKTKFSFR